MTDEQIVYLDTNHLSFLGRHPDDDIATTFIDTVQRVQAKVALSIIHLVELGNPLFKSGEEVGALLDDLPVVWAQSPDNLWQGEVSDAYSVALGLPFLTKKRFGNDVSIAIGGEDLGARPSQAIEAFRDPELRLEIEHATIAGLMFDALKTDASLIRERLLLLKRMISKLRPLQTPAGVPTPDTITPDDVVRAVGGLEGFPSYALMHRVASARLRDRTFRASRSDVFDLMHTAYSVYASFTALDRSYSSRVRRARPDLQSRVSHQLSELTGWLAA